MSQRKAASQSTPVGRETGPTGLSRRHFLRGACLGAGALSLASIDPRRAHGANERLHLGVIGCGQRGRGLLGTLLDRGVEEAVGVRAVSDVYQRRLDNAKNRCSGEGVLDYRRLLDRQDLDAVVIATPDHWHAKIAIDALESGKHVYVEKPMTHTIGQALALRNSVRSTGKVLQVGAQATSSDAYWKARDGIQAGRLGQVTWAQASYNRNARTCLFNDHQRLTPTAGPDKTGADFIDWKMWLGHEWNLAPEVEWTPEHFFRFRKYWPYSGGVATDLLYHKLAPLLIVLAGPEGEYPKRVSAGGGLYVEQDGRDIPDVFMMTVDYTHHSILLVSALTNDTQLSERVYGKYGTMELTAVPVAHPNGPYEKEFKLNNPEEGQIRLETEPRRDQIGNFLDVIRKGGTLHCGVELGASTMVAIRMAVDAYRQQKTFVWDAEKEEVARG